MIRISTDIYEKKEFPPISIVMATYNEEEYIHQTMESILGQTWMDWEFIIVDDGSTNGIVHTIKEFQKIDRRIQLIINQRNIGLAASLNRGIGFARGNYIARMDADDISYPDRLRLQKDFLDRNRKISVVGGNADLMDEFGNVIRSTTMPRTPEEIKNAIVRRNPLIHPSVMYRREFIEKLGGYDERLRKKQDYDLWFRGVRTHSYANIDEVIIKYRVQTSKPIITDLYGFYVRINNAHRFHYYKGVLWAFRILSVNILRKLGYTQRMHRKKNDNSKK